MLREMKYEMSILLASQCYVVQGCEYLRASIIYIYLYLYLCSQALCVSLYS